jgi:signal transduction histidine kinase
VEARHLLRPGGDPWKLVPYALAVSFVGSAGQLVIPVHFADYIWAASVAAHATYAPLLVLALAHLFAAALGPRASGAAVLALGIAGGCLAAQVLSIEFYQLLAGPETTPGKGYLYQLGFVRGPLLWWGLVGAAWYALKRAEQRAGEVADARSTADRLRASTSEARLQALQAQVEPHFLFNTLAHVRALYRRDPERGRRMLERFLDYLEAALPRVRQADTTLAQELELARAYLDIQQIRIGGRLAFSIEVPEEIRGLRFPPLMLLTLVENAIKHGIAPQTEGGAIGIVARADPRRLRIEVRDTGAGLSQAAGSGMGLANVRARLAALFGAGARLVIEPNAPRGVVAAIEIPR